MKKFLVNVFATTGISLLLLSIIALCFKAECLYLRTVFQVLGVNFVIHLELFLMQKIQMQYFMLEAVLEVSLIAGALIIFGAIFDWFTSTPIWILVIMGIVMYIVSLSLDLLRMRQEAQEINALIKNRNRKAEMEEE